MFPIEPQKSFVVEHFGKAVDERPVEFVQDFLGLRQHGPYGFVLESALIGHLLSRHPVHQGRIQPSWGKKNKAQLRESEVEKKKESCTVVRMRAVE